MFEFAKLIVYRLSLPIGSLFPVAITSINQWPILTSSQCQVYLLMEISEHRENACSGLSIDLRKQATAIYRSGMLFVLWRKLYKMGGAR